MSDATFHARGGKRSGYARRLRSEPRDRWIATRFIVLSVELGGRTRTLAQLERELATEPRTTVLSKAGKPRRIRTSTKMIELSLLCLKAEMRRLEARKGRELTQAEYHRLFERFPRVELAELLSRRRIRQIVDSWMIHGKKVKRTGNSPSA